MFGHHTNYSSMSENQHSTLEYIPILKEQSNNIEKRNVQDDKSQRKSNYTCSALFQQIDNSNINLSEKVCIESSKSFQQPIISMDISIIDERDDLLLSSTTIKSEKIMDQELKMCELHNKALDIVCLAEKTKICCYCALFGNHKDHNFKSQEQLKEEIDKKTKQLTVMEECFQNAKYSFSKEKQLTLIQDIYKEKKKNHLHQIEEQFNNIVNKITETKIQLQRKVKQQFDAKVNSFKQQWKQCQLNITTQKLFQDWKEYGENLLMNFRNVIHKNVITDLCNAYEQFPWKKGQLLIKDVVQKREEFIKKWRSNISVMNCSKYSLNNFYPLATNILNSMRGSQPKSQSPVTSITQFHQSNSFPQEYETIQDISGQPINHQQKLRFRHSQLIQNNFSSIRESIGASPNREGRNSHCILMAKKKRDLIYDSWNQSTVMNNTRSALNTQKTFISPKPRVSHCRSPRQSAIRQDPAKLVSIFQKSINQTILNLSNCNIGQEALIYFLQKAFASHIPIEINLSKNKLTQSSFVKLMPFFLKVQTINLASTGLSEGCLDQLLKIKGARRLEQVNLLDNNISLHRNRQKIQTLKQVGIKVICQ